MHKLDVPIYVSEYNIPEGWTEVDAFPVRNMRQGSRTEKLWVQDKFAESMVRDDATEQEKSESQVKFSIVDDPDELERLNNGNTVRRYRAMVEIDGKLYPPMSVYADGKLREPTKEGMWERSDETPLTDEQEAAIAALEENGETGDVVIIPDKLRYHKSSKKGKGKLQFKLNKDNGDYVWAAYNPYFHTSTSGMNDQFSSAWKRPNLVVVEVEIPESELTDGYQAPYAKDAVGNTPWKSGTVNNALPADRQRTVTLSRYAKVVGKVDDAKVAEGIAEQLKGLDIEVPFNVVTPSLRDELVKHGVKIGQPEKGNAGKASIPAYEEWLKSQGEEGDLAGTRIDEETGIRFSIGGEKGDSDLKPMSKKESKQYKSSGRGFFGDKYEQFKRDPHRAASFLMTKQSGEAIGVFHRDSIGDIDMPWGDYSSGLKHIIHKHVGEGLSFATIKDALNEIDDIIRNGKKVNPDTDKDKEVYKIGSKIVTIRTNYRERGVKKADKNWFLTAYDDSLADSESAIIASNQGHAALATNKSKRKSKTKISSAQENPKKIQKK